MIKFKKAVASLLAVAAIGAVGVSASAYDDNKFDFILSSSSYDWTDYEKKLDGFESAAVVTTENGTVSATKPVYTTVYYIKRLGNIYRVSTTAKIKSNTGKTSMSYTDADLVETGKTYSLLGENGAYSVTASGYWNP